MVAWQSYFLIGFLSLADSQEASLPNVNMKVLTPGHELQYESIAMGTRVYYRLSKLEPGGYEIKLSYPATVSFLILLLISANVACLSRVCEDSCVNLLPLQSFPQFD